MGTSESPSRANLRKFCLVLNDVTCVDSPGKHTAHPLEELLRIAAAVQVKLHSTNSPSHVKVKYSSIMSGSWAKGGPSALVRGRSVAAASK